MIAGWLVLLALVAASNIFLAYRLTFGILLGGITINLNFLWIYRDTWRLLKHKSPFMYFFGFVARLTLLALALGFILVRFPETFSIPGVLIGLSIGPLTLFVVLIQIWISGGLKHTGEQKNSEDKKRKKSTIKPD